MNTNFNEIIDIKKSQYIIEKYEDIKHLFRPESEERLTNINIDPLTLFKKYFSKGKKNKNGTKTINVSYKQNNDVGRYFAVGSLSLQTLPREIRHTISCDYYYDIDIVNCHPVLICEYAKSKNLKCRNIEKYINDRDNIFEKLTNDYNVPKDKIKNGFLCILNGAKTFLKMNDDDMPEFVKKYKKEVINIQKYIFENEPKYKKLGIANAKKKQNINNYNISNELGSTMNIMLCDIENKILQCMINYLNDQDLIKTNVTLVFDGFMIPKDNLKDVNINELLNKLEKEVLNETGYNIKLIEKPMNNIIKIPDDYLNSQLDNNINFKVIKDDKEGADKILSILDKKLYRCYNTIYYKYNNKWIDDIKMIKLLLKKLIIDEGFVKNKVATKEDIKNNEDIYIYLGVDYCINKFETYSSDNKGATNILDVLITKIEINDNLLKDIVNSSFNKVFFNNGYYDFNKSKFINNFDNVETLVKINHDYIDASLEDQQYVKKIIFESVFNDDVEEFLLMIARAIGGNIKDKIWSCIFGSRDAGKGIIQRSLIECFESYITTINANSLLSDSSTGDEAKKLSWAYNFDKHRIAFSNEMRITKDNEADGNLIKQICSGGDKMLLRKNNVDEKEVISQTTLILCANEIANFKPVDVYEKLIPFSLKTKFVSEEITPSLLKKNPFYKKADDNINDFIKQEKIINAITSLIFNSYKPTKVVNNNNMNIILETFTEDSDITKILFDNFEITGNPKHKVFNDVVKDFIKFNNIKISFTKIVNIFNTKGIEYKKTRIESSDAPRYAFIGLIKIVKENENNNESFID